MATNAQLIEAFRLFDRDVDGKATPRDILLILHSLGVIVTTTQMEKYFGSESLYTLEQFLDGAREIMKDVNPIENLTSAFGRIDTKRSGKVQLKELTHVVANLGELSIQKELDDLYKKIEVDTTGEFDYRQFAVKLYSAVN